MKRCSDCLHWKRSEEFGEDKGLCLRFPPQAVVFNDQLFWPVPETHAESKCGEFREIEESGY